MGERNYLPLSVYPHPACGMQESLVQRKDLNYRWYLYSATLPGSMFSPFNTVDITRDPGIVFNDVVKKE